MMGCSEIETKEFAVRMFATPAGAFLEMPVGVPPVRRRVRVSPLHLYLVLHGHRCELPVEDSVCEVCRQGDEVVFRPCRVWAEGTRIEAGRFEAALSEAFGIHRA
jgi:hypothetical protein